MSFGRTVQIRVDEKSILRLRKKLDSIDPQDRGGVIYKSFLVAAATIERRLKTNLSNVILRSRSGKLRASIGFIVRSSQGGISATIGSGVRTGARVKYADIHETGGTIRPKRSQYLAIPLPAARTQAGSTKSPDPRDFKNTFIQRSKAGNLIIFQKTGKNDLRPLFVLKKEVKVPARRYISRTAEQVEGRVITLIESSIVREIRK